MLFDLLFREKFDPTHITWGQTFLVTFLKIGIEILSVIQLSHFEFWILTCLTFNSWLVTELKSTVCSHNHLWRHKNINKSLLTNANTHRKILLSLGCASSVVLIISKTLGQLVLAILNVKFSIEGYKIWPEVLKERKIR